MTAALRVGLVALLSAPVAGCATDQPHNRGVESVHQPVVSYASYIFDVSVGDDGRLSPAERARFEGWLDTIDIRYGDRVALATESGSFDHAMRDGIATVVARHSLILEDDATAQAGRAPAGSVRVIVRRASASVPGCPDWRSKAENDGMGAASSNFGCATNGNLAAMVANPDDLVRGQTAESDLRTATANKGIAAWRDKTATGAGDLKSASVGGN
jgi:pilus assembly protein CpaD